MWYEIKVKGVKVADVYDTQDIIKISCDLVNGRGIDSDDIMVITHGKDEENA